MKSKTLIIQNLQGIGDTMWFVRHCQAIARATPEKQVCLLTRPRSMADKILQYDPYIEKILWLEIKGGKHDGLLGTLRLASLIREGGFKTVWILHSRSLRYALACRLAGVKNIYGPGIGLQKYLLSSGSLLDLEEHTKHPIIRGTLLLEKNGLHLGKETSPLYLGKGEEKRIKGILKDQKRPFWGIGIASSEEHKKWSWDSYVDLALSVHKKRGGTVCIMGGPLELGEGSRIQQALKEAGVDSITATQFSITESLALLSKIDFIVGNDTGILHAAPMVGTKGLVLLGSAQVPIHHHALVEGLRVNDNDPVQDPPNDLEQISVRMVMEKLSQLQWL